MIDRSATRPTTQMPAGWHRDQILWEATKPDIDNHKSILILSPNCEPLIVLARRSCSSQRDSSPRRCGILSATIRTMVSCLCLSRDNRATRWYLGKNRWHCVCWWFSLIDYDAWRQQGLIGDRLQHRTNILFLVSIPPWPKHCRFHDAFRKDWCTPQCWSLERVVDRISGIGRWLCRRGELDTPIADLDPWVLVRVRRLRDAARWDWVVDIHQLVRCLSPACWDIWWISAASWMGQRHMGRMNGTWRVGQGTIWHDGFGSLSPSPSDTPHNSHACNALKTWNKIII